VAEAISATEVDYALRDIAALARQQPIPPRSHEKFAGPEPLVFVLHE
jgi:hypothetical protein